MSTWPSTLPQDQFVSASVQARPNMLRSETESGIAKTRRLGTARNKILAVPIVLTGAQLEIFDSFFNNTLMDGVLPFEWEDLVTDLTTMFRFTAPVTFTLDIGASNSDDRVYRGQMSLETLP